MNKNLIALVFICGALSLFSVSGCETAKGASIGVAGTVQGAAEDTANLVGGGTNAIKAIDSWIKKNLW